MSRRKFCCVLMGAMVLAGLGITFGVTPRGSAQGVGVGLDKAIQVQEQHTNNLFAKNGVVGTAVGLNQNGRHVIQVYVVQPRDAAAIPKTLNGVPVVVQVTGQIVARVDPTARFPRPVPIGVSTGHPAITAGTIGCRVIDGAGNRLVLSNNHVLANTNNANIGEDPVLQPGPFDGGVNAADAIGTLFDFQLIDFEGGNNVIDAAIALSSTDDLGNATPSDGYGTPKSETVVAVIDQLVM